MYCPFCSALDTKVIDSRLVADGAEVRRRRECLTCGDRFTTFERAELVMPIVIKSDGTRQPFDESKMLAGIRRAVEKRPVETDEIDAAINRIKQALRASGEREIKSNQVGELVMNTLRELDEVAFVRFASVYRSFQDVSEFKAEIDRLKKDAKKE